MRVYRVVGGGLSGLIFGYIATYTGYDPMIYEKKDKNSWESSNLRPYVVKPSHLDLIASYAPNVYDIIVEHSVPVYKARKIVADFKSGKHVEFEYKSNTPIFYVINAVDLLKDIITEGDLKIKFGETTNGEIRAEGGSIWGNILGLGRLTEGEIDEVILWYDQKSIPGSYVFASPIPESGKSLIMAVIFDPNKYLKEIPPIVRPVEIIVRTGYTKPHLTEGTYITIGERGGWIDPLRGFGFYTSILSAIGTIEYLRKGKIPLYLEKLMRKIEKDIEKRSLLVKMSNKDLISMLQKENNYISVTEKL